MNQTVSHHEVRFPLASRATVDFRNYRPADVVYSSDQLGWSDLLVQERITRSGCDMDWPVGNYRDSIAFQLSADCPLWLRSGREEFRGCKLRHGATVWPRQVSREGRWEKPIHFLSIEPTHDLLVRTAATEFGAEASALEVRFQVRSHDPRLNVLAQLALNEIRSGGAGGRVMADILAQSFAVVFLRYFLARPLRAKPLEAALPERARRRVEEFIEAHLALLIGLEDLAAVAGLSPRQFTHAFRRATGRSPHQHLIERRVMRAVERLRHRDGDRTIADVAAEVGFYDEAHLCRHFKRRFGVAPRDW